MKYVLAILLACVCSAAKADYVIALHMPPSQCFPCRQMVPTEDYLGTQHYRIYRDNNAEGGAWARAAGVTAFPSYIYVQETPTGPVYTGCRLTGWQTMERLAAFCRNPVLYSDLPARNIVRSILNPLPIYPVYPPYGVVVCPSPVR